MKLRGKNQGSKDGVIMMNHNASGDRWFYFPQPNPAAHFRLFCFHYAGGSAQIFRPFAEALGGTAEVVAIQLPGRADRLGEPPFKRMTEVVDGLCLGAARLLDKPAVLFGQCMGALVAFEFARALRKRGLPPLALLASASSAPHLPRTTPPIHAMPDDEFISLLIQRIGRGPNMNLLDDPRFRPIFLTYFRADVELTEKYAYVEEAPFEFPIFALGGSEDPGVTREELIAWKRHSSAAFESSLFPGGHFYWMEQPEPLLARVKEILSGIGNSTGKGRSGSL